MRRILVNGLITALAVAFLAIPVAAMVWEKAHRRNLHIVRSGVLYRSAQLSTRDLDRVVRDLGIRTVVNLRDGSSPADQSEEAYCIGHGIRFVRIAPLSWDGVQGAAPVDQGLKTFLELVADPSNHPVLVHCFRGIHRTGMYVAVYRVELEGWELSRALKEMIEHGYVQLDDHRDVKGYFASYRRTGKYDFLAKPRLEHQLLR
jgi:tyrosine-protein phosphatase SIW14